MPPRSSQWLMTAAFVIVCSSSAVAQEAYLQQIGSHNGAANVAFGAKHMQSVFQAGQRNVGAQISSGSRNSSALIQAGVQNSALTVNQGSLNAALAVQVGGLNSSFIGINGHRNTVGLYQQGVWNQSSVTVTGNDTDVSVSQFGVGKRLALNVSDQMVRSSSSPTTNSRSPTGRFKVGVIQGRSSAPASYSIARAPDGSIVINP
ncbi:MULTISPECIES: hypothetical protein [unclassified Thioclava]|uniref:hypothetical protein n=1 Tax=unclassified Thioclava TaxID=2621713 RepID=UPI000B540E1E|nr:MULTISPECIES: hypothetical protein [unclassified Thioclava]OWY06541.1 hypothetical protein B6V76_01745 [Thioclava sp. IC9]OWY18543.1 hypothetical protein B6V73_01730 [Thioclava sp. JM3]PWE50547.1 hypothetical protein DEM26_06420 [Thioclava sp. NG1]